MKLFASTNIDFVKWRWHAIALSLLIIAVVVGNVGMFLSRRKAK